MATPRGAVSKNKDLGGPPDGPLESSVEFRAPALPDEDLALRFTERHADELNAKPATSDEPPEAPHDRSCITVNDFHAFMPSHGYIFAPTGAMWPAISVNALIPPIVDNGKAVPASTWLDRRRHVEQMTWAPGEPTVIRDRLIAGGGWTSIKARDASTSTRGQTSLTATPPKLAPGLATYGRSTPRKLAI